MFNSAAFDTFYSDRILPSIPQLGKEAREVKSWSISLAVFVLLGALFCGWLILTPAEVEGAFILFMFFAIMIVISLYQYARSKDVYVDSHKIKIIQEVISYVAPGVLYKPGKKVSSKAFKASKLYQYEYELFDGEDYLEGVIDGVSFQSSELNVGCKDPTDSGYIRSFKGLFVVAALSGNVAGGTFIWPRRGDKESERLKNYYELLPIAGTTKVKTGDHAFDSYFHIRTTSPAESANILHPERRNSLLQICMAIQRPLSCSFVAGRCYIGIPLQDNLLEPSGYEPGSKDAIKEYFITISLVTTLIRQLQLSRLL